MQVKVCEQVFDLLAVAAPSIIALFFITYTHKVLADLSRAEALARELPDDMRLFETARIRCGIGWRDVVGRNASLECCFNEEATTAAFRETLTLVGGRDKEYPYAWGFPVMTEYLKIHVCGLFIK